MYERAQCYPFFIMLLVIDYDDREHYLQEALDGKQF